MKKRLVSSMLAMALLCTLCCGVAAAAEARASEILSYYYVTLANGDVSGEIKVKYDVKSDKEGTVGVESIEIYTSNDTYVTTIYGSTANGLMKAGSVRCSGTYTYTGTPGTSYYAVVTVSAKAGTTYDSKTVTTATV